METLTEQRPDYEYVNVTSDIDDLPNPYDQAPENSQEQEPDASELQYIEGADGFYVRDPETGEAVLSMPLVVISGEQQDAFESVLIDGVAHIAVLTDFGTEDEEVWSHQTFSLSEAADGRRIITLRAIVERRPKYQQKEPQNQVDTFDTPEQAAAVSDARAAVEAALLDQDASDTQRLEPMPTSESSTPSYSFEKVEVAPAAQNQTEQADAPINAPAEPVLQSPAYGDAAPEPKNHEEAAVVEIVPVFEDVAVIPAPVIQPPLKITEPERAATPGVTADQPAITSADITPLAEAIAEPQTNAELTAETPSLSIESPVEPEAATVVLDEPSQFELSPVKQEPPEPLKIVKKAKPPVLPLVQKTIVVVAKAKTVPLVAAAPVVKAKLAAVPSAVTRITHRIKKQSTGRPPEIKVATKKEVQKAIHIAPQKTPIAALEVAKPVTIEQASPAPETTTTIPPAIVELVQEVSEEPYVQTHIKPMVEHHFIPHSTAPFEAANSSRTQPLSEQLRSPDWEQERNAQRLAFMLPSQGAATTDSEDIVVSFSLPNTSRRTPRARAARSVAA